MKLLLGERYRRRGRGHGGWDGRHDGRSAGADRSSSGHDHTAPDAAAATAAVHRAAVVAAIARVDRTVRAGVAAYRIDCGGGGGGDGDGGIRLVGDTAAVVAADAAQYRGGGVHSVGT